MSLSTCETALRALATKRTLTVADRAALVDAATQLQRARELMVDELYTFYHQSRNVIGAWDILAGETAPNSPERGQATRLFVYRLDLMRGRLEEWTERLEPFVAPE